MDPDNPYLEALTHRVAALEKEWEKRKEEEEEKLKDLSARIGEADPFPSSHGNPMGTEIVTAIILMIILSLAMIYKTWFVGG
jgi:hypothetical protein